MLGIGFLSKLTKSIPHLTLVRPLVVIALVMLALGVITSIHFQLRTMSAFELLTILGLLAGGLGLFLSSLRDASR